MATVTTLLTKISQFADWVGEQFQLTAFKEGGTVGQVPTKVDGTDFNWSWQTPPAPDFTPYQTKAGVLALDGFSSITGTISVANIEAGTAAINISGNAATVTTNANLTGVVTSVGNATAIADGAISLAKLATDPLARANHTGTQTWSTLTSTPTTFAGYGISFVAGTDFLTPSGTIAATTGINSATQSALDGKANLAGGNAFQDAQTFDVGITAGNVSATSGGFGDLTTGDIIVTGTTSYGTATTWSYGGASAAAHHTALGLGTLATQSGTFSGTSSGTNTGDDAPNADSNAYTDLMIGGIDLSGYQTKAGTLAIAGFGSVTGTWADANIASAATWNAKQAALVSGTNIKTVGGATLLGSGDVGTIGLAYGGTAATTASDARVKLGVERKNNLGMAVGSFRAARKNLRMVTFGDSLVNVPPLNLAGLFPQAGGYCRPDDSLDVSGSSLGTDWAYPGGRYVSLPNGSTRRWGVYSVTASDQPFLRASKFNIYYVRGTGTLRLRSSGGGLAATPTSPNTVFADITGHTAIDTSAGGAAGTIGVRTVTMTNSDYYRIDTVSDSGTIQILGIEAMEVVSGSRDQYRVCNLGLGGSFDSSWISTTQTNWTAMLGTSGIDPHIIVFKAWEDHITEAGTDWSTTLDRIRTAAPNAVLLLVGTYPTSGSTSPTSDPSGWDAAMKSYAETNSPMVQFADTRKYWPTYANMLSAGLINADGVHLEQAGHAFQNALLLDYVSTLTAAPEIRNDTATAVRNSLPTPEYFLASKFGQGPGTRFMGDLSNVNGDIGFGKITNAAASYGTAPNWRAFGNSIVNFRVAGGFALGNTAASHQFVNTSRNSNRGMFANFGDSESTLQRDPTGRIEIMPAATTEPALVLGAIASQSADIASYYTGVSLSTAGTKAGGIDKNGLYYNTPVAMSGAGAVSITCETTALTTTGAAQALTLADGIPGQTKTIMCVVDGGDAVLTPTTKTGYTTISFTAVGDTVTLQFFATYGWMVVFIRGAVAA